MFDVKIVDRILAVLGALLVIAATIIAGFGPEYLKPLFLQPKVPINPWLMLVGGVAIFYFVNRYVRVASEQKRNADQQFRLLEAELDVSIDKLQRDVVTGIPNQLKLKSDIELLATGIKRTDRYHLIMVDLDGFGSVNDRFGYQKGDEVIRYIAENTYNAMRRDEKAYKRPFAGETSSDDLWRRIYRKYSGGDEFVFVINGSESDALGFLLRLKRRFDGEFTRAVSEILGESWALSFHAGICPLCPGDTFEDAVQRVEECLRLARRKNSNSRAVWMTKISVPDAADRPRDGLAARLYEEAETAFSISPAP